LNLSYFISKRISREQRSGFASTIHKIAIVSIGIGLGAAIVSFLIMKGFQETIQNKIYGFNGHLLITKLTPSNSVDEEPMDFHVDAYDHPEQYPYIRHMQEYAHKTGLVKTQDEVLGVVFKGVGKSFDQKAFQENLIAGEFIQFPDSSHSNQVVISQIIADKLKAKVGDFIIVHFFQNPPRFRKLKISGIYETNLSEYFDSKVILGDIRLIARLNDWAEGVSGGLEVFLYDPEHAEEAREVLAESTDFDMRIDLISERYQQVFEWLGLVNRQVIILLCIILTVVCVNMISIVLILVMERTQMIGMLKALGGNDRLVRSIFIYQGFSLVIKGLFLGNLIGLGLCGLQYYFKIAKLNPHDYYMSFVPISWHWETVGMLNLLTLMVVTAVLIIPTEVIVRIRPIKAIRFD
jgi:lipoprotein-releasing system permease protein